MNTHNTMTVRVENPGFTNAGPHTSAIGVVKSEYKNLYQINDLRLNRGIRVFDSPINKASFQSIYFNNVI